MNFVTQFTTEQRIIQTMVEMNRNQCKGCRYEHSSYVQSPCLKCERFPKDVLPDYYEEK